MWLNTLLYFAPGTLGILPDTYLVPVSSWVVRRQCINVSIFKVCIQYMGIKYQNNLHYMGLSNISKINLQHMGLWVIGGLSM